MDLGLKDRVYVVTGATRGLGNASARELLADGAKVIITGRDEKTVAEAAAALGPNAHGVAVDNADPFRRIEQLPSGPDIKGTLEPNYKPATPYLKDKLFGR